MIDNNINSACQSNHIDTIVEITQDLACTYQYVRSSENI